MTFTSKEVALMHIHSINRIHESLLVIMWIAKTIGPEGHSEIGTQETIGQTGQTGRIGRIGRIGQTGRTG